MPGREHFALPAVGALQLRQQEIPFDHPDSRWVFRKRLVATRAAHDTFGPETILRCHEALLRLARRQDGIDYLQVFVDLEDDDRRLWFIEDGQVVTALLPSDY
jgi:hypothetical protein